MDSEEFYKSLGRMTLAAENDALVNRGLGDDDHNETARVLRNGLAVTSFAHLESFLQKRFDDLSEFFASSILPYGEFPEPLKKFFTMHALQGLVNRTYLQPKIDRRVYSESNLVKISGFGSNPQSLTAFGFSLSGSNVLSDDLKNGLTAFGVQEPWEYLKGVCTKIGAGSLDLAVAYSNISRTRNSAAHDAANDIPTGDLKSHLREILDIACSAHVATAHLSLSVRRTTEYQKFVQTFNNDTRLRFVDLRPDGLYVERPRLNGPAIKKTSCFERRNCDRQSKKRKSSCHCA